MVIPSELRAARAAQETLLAELAASGYTPGAIFAIKLAVEEAVSNAVKHGNRGDKHKRVQLTYEVLSDRTRITVSDEGSGFDHSNVDDPTIDENLEKPTGRGVMLMRAYMDEVEYNEKGNQVRMMKLNT